MQVELKTILNAVQHFPGFVYQDVRLLRRRSGRPRELHITVAAHTGHPAKCSQCHRPAPGYDRLPQRLWLFIPLWGMVTWFAYAARRVNCPESSELFRQRFFQIYSPAAWVWVWSFVWSGLPCCFSACR